LQRALNAPRVIIVPDEEEINELVETRVVLDENHPQEEMARSREPTFGGSKRVRELEFMTKDSNQDDGLFLYFHYILTSFFRRRKKIERRWMGMGE
jgi:hypothetical protein